MTTIPTDPGGNMPLGDRFAVSGSNRRTLEALSRHPVAHNLTWNDVVSLFEKLGTVEHKSNAEFVFQVGSERHLMRRPHSKDLTAEEVVDLRKFLTRARSEAKPAAETTDHTGPNILVVIDHHEAKLYDVDVTANDASRHVIKPYDPHHFQHHLTHKDQSREEGQRTAEDPGFYEMIAQSLASAGKIVVIGHGHGKSNAADHIVEYLRTNHSETYRRIAREISTDLSSITLPQLLGLAHHALQQA